MKVLENLAFCGCFGPEMPGAVQDGVATRVLQIADRMLNETGWSAKDGYRVVRYLAAVAGASTPEYRKALLDRAYVVKQRIQDDGKGISAQYAGMATAVLAKAKGTKSRAELTGELETALETAASEEQRERECELRGRLGQSLALIQRIRDARLVTVGYGERGQLEAALGILENEVIRQESTVTSGLQRRLFLLRVALDEDLWIPED